nr:Chain C, Vpr protein [Human immunodeficiency virus 1]
FPRPWLHGL